MTDPTALDLAHRAMAAAPEDPSPRLRWYGALSASELYLLLDREPAGDRLAPRVFRLDTGPVVLAFDRATRLTDFTAEPAPYAALPGRALAELLAGQGLGLGINLGTEDGELLPPDAIDWWAGMLAPAPEPRMLAAGTPTPPPDLPAPLLAALDRCLATATGLAACACLAGLRQEDGSHGLVLAFLDPRPGAETALARAAAEALRFCGLDEAELDIAFLAADHPDAARLARIGLRIDLAPPPSPPSGQADPDAPPRLR
ncbi:SseB family protein [Rhodovulum steppense]|uniref:Type III secretion system (T3SS) SseB-like protein n=1 Tax=Rhodovulum steppense TaxID=540251 RepID=A0A4R1YWY8_9RHOB|nr:SseB family protein [Rhodovulum steppense]TCM85712.1 type III secretion system (T3SS) SseB-like protein [Rhodovulum steppense]